MVRQVSFSYISHQGTPLSTPDVNETLTLSKLLITLLGKTVPQLSGMILYKLETPLHNETYPEDVDMIEACFAARSRWKRISQRSRVKDLADAQYLSDDYLCLIIELPDVQADKAVTNLDTYHTALFRSLQLVLKNIMSFSKDDVTYNLRSNDFWGHGEARTDPAINQLETDLAEKRTFDPQTPDIDTPSDFDIAMRYPEHFAEYFTQSDSPTAEFVIINKREFIAFFALFRGHADVKKIAESTAGSKMKANHLYSLFLYPPFFVGHPPPGHTKLLAKLPWKFPIFIATHAHPAEWSKFTPNSDFSIVVDDFLCPLLVCEVVSDPAESDRWRMLLQGIALARAVYCLKRPDSAIRFFVAGVYLCSNLIAERYIIMQTDLTGKVAIAQTNYDLRIPVHCRDFLKEMFNLQIKVDAMTAELDDAQKTALRGVANVAATIMSLSKRRAERSSAKKSNRPGPSSAALDAVAEDAHDLTQDSEVRAHLNAAGYVLETLVPRHQNVATVCSKTDPAARGFLKLTHTSEMEILKSLMDIKDPCNHTILGAQFWSHSSGGVVLYTPSGGRHLTHLRHPDHHMWSAAQQLVKGVAFMHEHHIAHLDIKPANVLIPVDGGHLSIIDFSLAMFVTTPGQKVRGEVGTEGYMAPEVGESADFDPIRADLWSCGQTLYELTMLCEHPFDKRRKEFLVGIAVLLLHNDPQVRPTMLDVLGLMEDFELDPVKRPQVTFPSLKVASGTHA